MQYLAIDTETGGFAGTSLLSIYLGLFTEEFEPIEELDLLVKPADGIYKVTGEALNVNKINLIEHDKKALTYKEAGTLIYNFIKDYSINGTNKLEPLGHHVPFDIERIKSDLLSEGSWLTHVSYRYSDTGVIGNYLKKKGKIPSEISGSLTSYASYFGLDTSGAHTAKGDSLMCMEVFKRMLKL